MQTVDARKLTKTRNFLQHRRKWYGTFINDADVTTTFGIWYVVPSTVFDAVPIAERNLTKSHTDADGKIEYEERYVSFEELNRHLNSSAIRPPQHMESLNAELRTVSKPTTIPVSYPVQRDSKREE